MQEQVIIVALNYVNFNDPKKRRNQEIAMRVLEANKPDNCRVFVFNFPWEEVHAPARFTICKTLQRNSREEIGNTRDLPYIKEIFDTCHDLPCDFFGYINSDILLARDFFEVFDDSIDGYIFSRTEIGEVSRYGFNKRKIYRIPGGDQHPGCDGFFFRKQWYGKHRHEFHEDLILGETEWDTVYRTVILHECRRYLMERQLYHVYHDAKWTLTSPGAVNNIAIWNGVKDKYGL